MKKTLHESVEEFLFSVNEIITAIIKALKEILEWISIKLER